MHLVTNSITVVLLGDWNRLYTQPEWVANEIYESPTIEIGVEGKTNFRVSYRKDNVTITPTQSKIVFTAINAKKETLELMSKCVNNYLKKAFTPQLTAYGINADYSDTEDIRLATVFDSMSDANAILELGYEIAATQIHRALSKDGKTINMKCDMKHTQTTIHFNEHHAAPDKDSIVINLESLLQFIQQTQDIVTGLGYEIEGS